MRRLTKLLVTMAVVATCLLGSASAHAAQAEAWVKVEFKFRVGGKTATALIDLPVPYARDMPQYCERDLLANGKGLAYFVQQGDPELENAKFVSVECVTEGGKIKWAKRPTNRLPSLKRPQPVADPSELTGTQAVTYQVDLLYEKIVDGVRPKKYVRVPMRAANAQAAVSMCGGYMNMLRLGRNMQAKDPFALGLTGNWMAGGGKCVTDKNGYIEMSVAESSRGSN
jgi:hypothetical protein